MASAAPAENTSIVLVGPVQRTRPGLYTEELGISICERIAAGERLRAICAEPEMPSIQTVCKWLLRLPDFDLAYTRARDAQQHIENERCLEIADDLTILPEHKRIMVDTRKWTAERLNRKSYGNSIKHEHELTPAEPLVAGRLPDALTFLDKRSGGDGD